MKSCNYIFYTPEYQYPGMPHGEMCGDLMPCWHDGKYVFLFLYKYCIYAVETADFVHYSDARLVLRNGTPDEQDWHAATGSICEKNGTYYFYYTGFCEGNRGKEGRYEQAILRAYSTDMLHWQKDTGFFMAPDEEHYMPPHWRDPHVFWNEWLKKYCMLVTACERDGAVQRSGCTAVYVSDDILEWEHYRTICSPRIYPTMECQDCFRMGDTWYLTYSSYEKQWETRYKTASSFEGPWKTPPFDDKFDGRDFYAAKTVSDGTHRYLVGWQSIRKDCSDHGRYIWGGNVLVHELVQRKDGTLGVKLPDTIRSSFRNRKNCVFEKMQGLWTKEKGAGRDDSRTEENPLTGDMSFRGSAYDGFGWARLSSMPNVCMIHAVLTWEEGTQAAGVMFHTEGDRLEHWCQLRLEPQHNRICLERSGKTELDQYFDEERSVKFEGTSAEITILTSNEIIVAYVNDTALSGRCYAAKPGSAGVFVEYGMVRADVFEVYEGECENIPG